MSKNLVSLLAIGGVFITTSAAALTLKSPAFQQNSFIPTQYTCHGADQSPPLVWSELPINTQSLALVVNDLYDPINSWTHWIVFNIPINITQLQAGDNISTIGARTALNSWNNAKYQGPCPPQFTAHSYVFTLYALDTVLYLENGAPKDQVLNAITGHVIGSAQIVGLYQAP